jgi:hypothetical protein
MRGSFASLVPAALGVLGVLAVACESRVSLGARCTTAAECAAGLSCTAGRCRAACTTEQDCAEGLRCLRGEDGVDACSVQPEEECVTLADCGDAFVACRQGRCETGCTDESDCVSGTCVDGSCGEPTVSGLDEVGRIALGGGAADVAARSFVLHAPEDPARALDLATAPGFTDLDVAVEPVGAGDRSFRLYLTTMESPAEQRGLPVLLDVTLRGASADGVTRLVAGGSNATSTAAALQRDGRPAFLWLVRDVDGPDQPDDFAIYLRAQEGVLGMRTNDPEARYPGQAAVAWGLGVEDGGPAWGVRVVSPTQNAFAAVAPSGGLGSEASLPLPDDDRAAVDAQGTYRGFLLRRTSARSVHFVRVSGSDELEGSLQDLPMASTCAPGIAHIATATGGNYVVATCTSRTVELRRLECPAMSPLAACSVVPITRIQLAGEPAEVSLERWPGGVALVARRQSTGSLDGGVDIHLVGDPTLAGTDVAVDDVPTFSGVLPPSYQLDAFTDFQLRHVASASASGEGASVLVVAGLYEDDNQVAQVRLHVMQVTAR